MVVRIRVWIALSHLSVTHVSRGKREQKLHSGSDGGAIIAVLIGLSVAKQLADAKTMDIALGSRVICMKAQTPHAHLPNDGHGAWARLQISVNSSKSGLDYSSAPLRRSSRTNRRYSMKKWRQMHVT
jgi:hypothetical protein